jgi:hypothetical protein
MRSGTALLLTRAFVISTFRFPLTALLLRFTLSSCTAFLSEPITGSAAEGCLRPVEAVQTWLATAEICTGPVTPVLKGQRVQAVPLSAFSAAQIVKAVSNVPASTRCSSPGTRCARTLPRSPSTAEMQELARV